jgi:iron complex transport system substrate-binding protein
MLGMVLSGCNLKGETSASEKKVAEEKAITDMAGRQVTIPSDIEKVYSLNSIGTIFLYTIDPERLAGWNSELGSEKQFIKEKYYDLPVLGTYKGPNSINIEQLLKTKPDIIVNMGDINEEYIKESDELQKTTGIPVIMVDGSLDRQSDAYTFLGDLLNKEDRGKELADYSKKVLNSVREKSKLIPDNERIQVYYAAGSQGLETSPKGSINTEVLEWVGGINAASGVDQNMRKMEVSLEQVITWNPEMIIISPDSADKHELYELIQTDESWSHIKAVQTKNVYEIPYGPYDWFNRPPSVLRLMGMVWLGNLLYPDVYQTDVEQEVRDFYKLFFDRQLSDEEIAKLLERSVAVDE